MFKAIFGHNAIEKGMRQQADATALANQSLERMYNQQRDDIMPWNQRGLSALAEMDNPDFKRDFTQADFVEDPGYQFRMAEGQKALERSAAARGSLQGGATMKALARYGQDFASNEYQNVYNRFNADRDRRFGRLSSIAGFGANAMGQLVNAGGSYGNAVSQNQIGMGNAFAAGGMAKANATQQGISSLMKMGSTIASGGMA
jgi:hypothetical protein